MTPEERVSYTAKLTAAETAYHELMIGGGVKTIVDQNGERVEFNVASSSRLAAYIQYLKGLLGLSGSTSGPMRFLGR